MTVKSSHYISAIVVFLLLIRITWGQSGQYSPVLTIGNFTSTESLMTIPVMASNFNNITAGDLKIQYNPEVGVPVDIKKGAILPGNLDFNISEEGVIRLGWYSYPAVHLPDGTVMFDIVFKRTGIGAMGIIFDDAVSDMDCQFYDGTHNRLNDYPFDAYYKSGVLEFRHDGPVTSAPEITAFLNETVSVPIPVHGFSNIGAVSLLLKYDPAVLEYNDAEVPAGFPGLVVYNPVPGTITVSGVTNDEDGISLPDGALLFTLNFKYKGGASDLIWYDDGTSCEYAGPLSAYVINDLPHHDYFKNGWIGNCHGPDTPVLKVVQPDCFSATGSIVVLSPPGADYLYCIDGGDCQSSNTFLNLMPGRYLVTVTGINGCMSTAAEAVLTDEVLRHDVPVVAVEEATCTDAGSACIANYDGSCTYVFNPSGPATDDNGNITGFEPGQVYTLVASNTSRCVSLPAEPFVINSMKEAPLPVISVMHDTGESEIASLLLTAGKGEHYLWSTGETSQSIVVNATGEYFVEVVYENGCAVTSAVLPVIILPTQVIETAGDKLVVTSYPNPFSEQVNIEFLAPASAIACINIYDLNGRLMKNVFNDRVEKGRIYHVPFIPDSHGSNIYIYTVSVDDQISRGKIIHIN